MRILFIGCVRSSFELLDTLLQNGKDVCGIVTKSKSVFNSDFVDLARLGDQHNIPVWHADKTDKPTLIHAIKEKKPDIIYCFGWSELLSSELVELPDQGAVGFHPAKLPFNKGRHPIIWALVLGLSTTASTFFFLEKEADTGPIISQVDINITHEDDAGVLYSRIIEVAKTQLLVLTDDFEKGHVKSRKQDPLAGNVWRKRTKKDGVIDFRMSARNIYNLVRALTRPYVGAHFTYRGKEYKVWSCDVVEDIDGIYSHIEHGKVIEVYSPISFLVKTGDHLLNIIECDPIEIGEGEYL